MAQYLNVNELLARKPTIKNKDQALIQEAIINASNYIDSEISLFITNNLANGNYVLDDQQRVQIVPGKEQDNTLGISRLNVIKDSIAELAKFSINTGWDYINGAMSTSIGSQSVSESQNYRDSFENIITTIRRWLVNVGFDNLQTQSHQLTLSPISTVESGDWVDGTTRPLNIANLLNILTDTIYITGKNGISWRLKDSTQPDMGVYIELDEALLRKYIADNISAAGSTLTELTTNDLGNLNLFWDIYLKQNIANSKGGDRALIKYTPTDQNDPFNNLVESYVFIGSAWEKASFNYETSIAILTFAEQFSLVKTEVELLIAQNTEQDAKLVKAVTTDNDKDIASKGNIAPSGTPTDPGMAVIRSDLGAIYATLDNLLTQLDQRVSVFENTLSLGDIVWQWDGVIANQHLITASLDLKTISNLLSFAEGKRSTIAIQKIDDGIIVSHNITASASTLKTDFVYGNKSLTVYIDQNGIMHTTFNGATINNYRLFEIIQPQPATALGSVYSKTESDARFAPIQSNTLTTTAKNTILAINEVNNKANTNTTGLNTLKGRVDANDPKINVLVSSLNAIQWQGGKVFKVGYNNEFKLRSSYASNNAAFTIMWYKSGGAINGVISSDGATEGSKNQTTDDIYGTYPAWYDGSHVYISFIGHTGKTGWLFFEGSNENTYDLLSRHEWINAVPTSGVTKINCEYYNIGFKSKIDVVNGKRYIGTGVVNAGQHKNLVELTQLTDKQSSILDGEPVSQTEKDKWNAGTGGGTGTGLTAKQTQVLNSFLDIDSGKVAKINTVKKCIITISSVTGHMDKITVFKDSAGWKKVSSTFNSAGAYGNQSGWDLFTVGYTADAVYVKFNDNNEPFKINVVAGEELEKANLIEQVDAYPTANITAIDNLWTTEFLQTYKEDIDKTKKGLSAFPIPSGKITHLKTTTGTNSLFSIHCVLDNTAIEYKLMKKETNEGRFWVLKRGDKEADDTQNVYIKAYNHTDGTMYLDTSPFGGKVLFLTVEMIGTNNPQTATAVDMVEFIDSLPSSGITEITKEYINLSATGGLTPEQLTKFNNLTVGTKDIRIQAGKTCKVSAGGNAITLSAHIVGSGFQQVYIVHSVTGWGAYGFGADQDNTNLTDQFTIKHSGGDIFITGIPNNRQFVVSLHSTDDINSISMVEVDTNTGTDVLTIQQLIPQMSEINALKPTIIPNGNGVKITINQNDLAIYKCVLAGDTSELLYIDYEGVQYNPLNSPNELFSVFFDDTTAGTKIYYIFNTINVGTSKSFNVYLEKGSSSLIQSFTTLPSNVNKKLLTSTFAIGVSKFLDQNYVSLVADYLTNSTQNLYGIDASKFIGRNAIIDINIGTDTIALPIYFSKNATNIFVSGQINLGDNEFGCYLSYNLQGSFVEGKKWHYSVQHTGNNITRQKVIYDPITGSEIVSLKFNINS